MSYLDGNAFAGMLTTAFGQDMTAAIATCAGCGSARPLAEARAFLGAGTVLRCARCNTVLLAFVDHGDVLGVDGQGLAALALPS